MQTKGEKLTNRVIQKIEKGWVRPVITLTNSFGEGYFLNLAR